ncbi:MAG: hypothetical protein H0T79_15610 [Deltaproteobacteria bacterium]|nr:hypothetical protein [Deltaproteobacteria bacterium]
MRSFLFATVVVVALALRATPAWADDPAQAGKHFTAGQAAEQRGDWQSAIAEYEQAYALAPHPSVLFNLAHAHEQLEGYRRAAEFLRKYLADNPDAEDRAVVQQRIVDLRDRSSRLRVISTPGAELRVDGVARGATPAEIEIASGSHTAHVTFEDRSSAPVTFTVEYGEPHDLTLAVRPAPAPLDVAPVTLAFVMGLGIHPALGAEWDSATPISLSARLRVGARLGSRLRLFAEFGGTVGPAIEDNRVGIELGPKERFVVLTPRAGASLTLWRDPGTWRVDAFGVLGAVLGYHSLSFEPETVARQSVSGVGAGAGLEAVFASQTVPRQHWLISVGWFVMPTDVGTNTGFRSTGTVDLGGLELVIGWSAALGAVK